MPKQITYDTHFNYGVGVDSSAEQARGTAVIPTPPATIVGGGGAKIAYSSHFAQSQRQLESALGVSAAMSLNYGFVAGGNLKVDFASQHNVDDYALSIVVKVTVERPVLQMSGVKLTPEARDLFTRSPDDFKARYGDMYVNGVLTGGELLGIIVMHTHSESEKTDLKVHLDASGMFGPVGASLTSDFQSKLRTETSNTECQVFVTSSGYTPPRYPNTVDSLLNFAAEFPDKVKSTGEATPYAVDLMDYKFLDLPSGPNLADLQNRDEVIRYLAGLKAEATAKRASIDFIRGQPTLFANVDQAKLAELNAAEAQLNTFLDQIYSKVSACFNDWRNCAFADGASLTMPLIQLPEPLPIQESPIAAKYRLTGGPNGFLGAPVSNEDLPCMDGQGKYRPFQWGAIFWHPSIGAFEVHGTIYQKYQQLRCEQGALGYPVSDEKSQANSVDRYSRFQHGVINWTASDNLAQEVINPPQFVGTELIGAFLQHAQVRDLQTFHR